MPTPVATRAAITDLQVRRVEPEVGIRLIGERAGTERLDLGIERGTHAAHLALGHRGDAEGLDEILHPPRADPDHVRFLHHREEGAFGASPGFEQAREVAAIPDPRDRQVDRADAGIPAPLPVAVAAGQSSLRVSFAMGHAGDLGDLRFHHRLGEHPQAFSQEVHVPVTDRLAYRLEQRHSVLGHRVLPFVVGSLLQRREDDAVAVLHLGLPAVTPTMGT
jgi:hypothetical protein